MIDQYALKRSHFGGNYENHFRVKTSNKVLHNYDISDENYHQTCKQKHISLQARQVLPFDNHF